MNPIIQKLGVLAAMLPAFLSASAYDFEVNGIFYNITTPTAKEVEVTYETNEYTASYSGDIVVPSSVSYNGEQYIVTAIGEAAFYDCENLTSITLPNSLTTIGDEAFQYCRLTSITLPNSVTTIGDHAFYECIRLTSITLPGSLTTIGDDVFSGCNSLTSIDVDVDNQKYSSIDGVLYDKSQMSLICCPAGKAGEVIVPNTVTTIGYGAFAYCHRLTSITLPNSVTTIGDLAFANCLRLASIILSNSVTTIGDSAFAYCYSLTSITLPNSVTTIGYGAFSYCRSLTSITIPGSVTSIENDAFGWDSVLKSIDVDIDNQKYSSIDGVLYDKLQTNLICCPGGKSGDVIIPNTVTTIGVGAFRSCSNLTTITLPNSVTAIEYEAFHSCSSLTSITSLAVTPPECGEYVFYEIDKQRCTLYVPAESIEAYKQAPEWKDFILVEETSGIDLIVADPSAEVEAFKLNGTRVPGPVENLPAGIYIVREGSTARKIIVR